MPDNVLVATPGRSTGSAAARRLRAQDHIPAVIYGHGADPISVTVERRELRHAVSGPAGFNTILTLQVGNESFAALIKQAQRHPVKRTVSHVDFLRVKMDQELTINVPIRLVGEAKAVLAADGLVDPAVDAIEVVTTPQNMPNEFVIDITNMQPGDTIRLSDVTIPAGSTPTGDPDMAIVTAIAGTVLEEPEVTEAEEGEEGAEAAEGEGTGGEAAGGEGADTE
jgi:large subunit ribosomal protein L25